MHHIWWESLTSRVPQFFKSATQNDQDFIHLWYYISKYMLTPSRHLLNSLQIQEIFLCSYNSEPAAFQCTQSPSVSFCKVEPSARSQIIHITQRFHCNLHAIVTLCSFGLCDSRCPIWADLRTIATPFTGLDCLSNSSFSAEILKLSAQLAAGSHAPEYTHRTRSEMMKTRPVLLGVNLGFIWEAHAEGFSECRMIVGWSDPALVLTFYWRVNAERRESERNVHKRTALNNTDHPRALGQLKELWLTSLAQIYHTCCVGVHLTHTSYSICSK